MTFLHILSYVAGTAAFVFIVLSIASGLLYLAELIEEHSMAARTVGRRATLAVIGIHVLLYLIDSFPLSLTTFSILCHLLYLLHFSSSRWPRIPLLSPVFLLSCAGVVADHFLWFFYLTRKAREHRQAIPRFPYHHDAGQVRSDSDLWAQRPPTFLETTAFFGVCVWAVPFFLFLSVSANDQAFAFHTADPSGSGDAAPSMSIPHRRPYQSHGHRPSATPAQLSKSRSLFRSLVGGFSFTAGGGGGGDGVSARGVDHGYG